MRERSARVPARFIIPRDARSQDSLVPFQDADRSRTHVSRMRFDERSRSRLDLGVIRRPEKRSDCVIYGLAEALPPWRP